MLSTLTSTSAYLFNKIFTSTLFILLISAFIVLQQTESFNVFTFILIAVLSSLLYIIYNSELGTNIENSVAPTTYPPSSIGHDGIGFIN